MSETKSKIVFFILYFSDIFPCFENMRPFFDGVSKHVFDSIALGQTKRKPTKKAEVRLDLAMERRRS